VLQVSLALITKVKEFRLWFLEQIRTVWSRRYSRQLMANIMSGSYVAKLALYQANLSPGYTEVSLPLKLILNR
jgi:hypothetical protein